MSRTNWGRTAEHHITGGASFTKVLRWAKAQRGRLEYIHPFRREAQKLHPGHKGNLWVFEAYLRAP